MRKKQLLGQNELLFKKIEEADGVITSLNADINKKDDEIKTLKFRIDELLKQVELLTTQADVSETVDCNPDFSSENVVAEITSAVSEIDVSDEFTDDYVHEFAVDTISKMILKTTKALYSNGINEVSANIIKDKCESTKEEILSILMSNLTNSKKIEEINIEYNKLLEKI